MTEGVTTKSRVMWSFISLTQAFVLPLLSTILRWKVYTYIFAAVMLCTEDFEVCKWRRSDSPTYSGVPRISRNSDTLSTRRDKPKSTIRMSPSGLALVNRMFWGWRWHYRCERKETLNYRAEPVSPIIIIKHLHLLVLIFHLLFNNLIVACKKIPFFKCPINHLSNGFHKAWTLSSLKSNAFIQSNIPRHKTSTCDAIRLKHLPLLQYNQVWLIVLSTLLKVIQSHYFCKCYLTFLLTYTSCCYAINVKPKNK